MLYTMVSVIQTLSSHVVQKIQLKPLSSHNACGCHFASRKTVTKVVQCGLYWHTLFNDYYEYTHNYEECQHLGKVNKK